MHSSVIPNYPVDSTWTTLGINNRVIFAVYDISRAIPEDFRVFPNFPKYYYEYYILSFYYV